MQHVVEIREMATGKVRTTVPVSLRGLDYTPSEVDWFNEGWRAAVEDKCVSAEDRAKYEFRLIRCPA